MIEPPIYLFCNAAFVCSGVVTKLAVLSKQVLSDDFSVFTKVTVLFKQVLSANFVWCYDFLSNGLSNGLFLVTYMEESIGNNTHLYTFVNVMHGC